jgi:hypothetical protein
MREVVVIAVVGGIVAVTTILGLGLVTAIAIRAVRGGGSKASKQTDAGKTEIIQEIYHSLRKMEKRIESLETLLLDDESARRAGFDDELRKE